MVVPLANPARVARIDVLAVFGQPKLGDAGVAPGAYVVVGGEFVQVAVHQDQVGVEVAPIIALAFMAIVTSSPVLPEKR